MEVDETGDKLRTYRSRADISATCSRLCEAFALIDDLDALVEIPAGTAASVGQRVTIVSGGSVGSRDGVVKSCVTPGFLNVILDDGLLVSDVSDRDVIGLIKEKDAHLDFVSRIVWSQALSEGRLPLSGAHLLPALCPWEMCERAFHLTEPWTEHLWTTPPALADIGFNSWLYLFAESIRMKAKASLVLALRIVEEAAKQLASAEDPSSSLRSAFLVGVGELVRYWPAAVTVLGVSEAGGPHGAFSILRHMLSTQAVKVLRALYRKPTQIDMGSEVILDKSLLKRRCAYYIEMQRAAEDELRDHFSSSPFSEVGRSGSLFGDGQAAWNAGWLCSVESDVVGVCREMRSSMKLADTCGDNDFVAAKSRWDLAGYLYFGGEGETYDLRQVTKLAKEAELLGEKLDLLGMNFFVNGESICSSIVKEIVIKYEGKAPFIVPVHRLSSSALGSSVPAVTKDVCANCRKQSDKLMMCGRCKQTKYCSRDCQVTHFKNGHKKCCKAAL